MDVNELLTKADRKLKDVHPLIADKMRQVIKKSHSEGIYIIITQGLRTIAEQNALYAQGRTKPGQKVTNAKGGYSYHNFGLAVDFCVTDIKGNPEWTVDKRWRRVGAIGQSLGLEWGGAWKSFVDIPHFQHTFGLSLAQLRAGKRPPNNVTIPTTSTSKSYLEKGDRGEKVKELQEKLTKIGIDCGKVDGIFGDGVLAAVLILQKRKGLVADGLVGNGTWKVINDLIAEQNKPVETKGKYRVYTGSFPNKESLNKAVKEIGYSAFIKDNRVFTGIFTTLESATKAKNEIASKYGYNPQIRKED